MPSTKPWIATALLSTCALFGACSTTDDGAVAAAPRERAPCVEVTGSNVCHRTDRSKPGVATISGQDIRDAGAPIGQAPKAGPSGN